MASADQAATTDEGGGRGTTKGPMEAFGMLAQGIAQLQTAMSATMTHRAQELEVVKPGISELPKLPELSETSCIDIGDWIHSLQCPMGDLSNGSSGWWKETQQCLDRFYNTYLESSNLVKLTLKPETFATAYLKEKWTRVDKRATSMILSSLPDTVRAEVLALRLTGTLAVLGRVMVLYRPGSAAERQQILKALESPSTATSAAEAVDMLRRWALATASRGCWFEVSRCQCASTRTGYDDEAGVTRPRGDPVQDEHDEVHTGSGFQTDPEVCGRSTPRNVVGV